MSYSAILVPGVQPSARRGIAFLASNTDQTIDAKKAFEGLNTNRKRDILSRFDYWLGGEKCDKYFHGWPNDQDRKECFVFKWKEAGTHHRLYGFLSHPKPSKDPGFQACILVTHAQKNTEHTDASELDTVIALRQLAVVIAAVKEAFPEEKK